MKIHLYTLAWNEINLVPFFLHYYAPICEKIIVFDNGSTDDSMQLLKSEPKVEIRSWNPDGSICENAAKLKSTVWKESIGQADWAIVIDFDEFVYHPNLIDYLSNLDSDVMAIQSIGYDMVCDSFPTYDGKCLTEIVRNGVPNHYYNKVSLFRLNKMCSFDYVVGCHGICKSEFYIVYPNAQDIKMFHYRYLGRDETYERYQRLGEKLRPNDIKKGYGHQYFVDKKKFDQDFDDNINNSKSI